MRSKLPCIGFVLFSCLFCTVGCADVRRITVKVVDDEGEPVPEATVSMFGVGYTHEKTKIIKKTTDADGIVESELSADLRFEIRVEKEGCYMSESGRLRRDRDHDVTYTLREIRQPVRLFAMQFFGKLPEMGSPCGFDFQKGDWVTPHGKGAVADLVFTAAVEDADPENIKGVLMISFPGEDEGALQVESGEGFLPYSGLTMPNIAPREDYKKKIIREFSPSEPIRRKSSISYFFRTRETKLDGEKLFYYSKFHSGFTFRIRGGRFEQDDIGKKLRPNEYAHVSFVYYQNPELGDRNLEFEPGKSLIPLKDHARKVFQP